MTTSIDGKKYQNLLESLKQAEGNSAVTVSDIVAGHAEVLAYISDLQLYENDHMDVTVMRLFSEFVLKASYFNAIPEMIKYMTGNDNNGDNIAPFPIPNGLVEVYVNAGLGSIFCAADYHIKCIIPRIDGMENLDIHSFLRNRTVLIDPEDHTVAILDVNGEEVISTAGFDVVDIKTECPQLLSLSSFQYNNEGNFFAPVLNKKSEYLLGTGIFDGALENFNEVSCNIAEGQYESAIIGKVMLG